MCARMCAGAGPGIGSVGRLTPWIMLIISHIGSFGNWHFANRIHTRVFIYWHYSFFIPTSFSEHNDRPWNRGKRQQNWNWYKGCFCLPGSLPLPRLLPALSVAGNHVFILMDWLKEGLLRSPIAKTCFFLISFRSAITQLISLRPFPAPVKQA